MFYYYIAAVLVVTLLIYLKRRWISSFVFGILDYYFFFVYFRPLMKGKLNFWRGWGEKERFQKIMNIEISHKPSKIEHVFEGKQESVVYERLKLVYFRQLFRWKSPVAKYLRKGEEIAEYSLMTTKKEGSGHCLLIILPASGQEGFGWRAKNIALKVMKESGGKIDCLLPVVACYGSRKAKFQKEGGISWMTTCDAPMTPIHMSEETRCYIYHYAPKLYKHVIVCGFSIGASVASMVSNSFISDEKISFGCVSAIGGIHTEDFDSSIFKYVLNYEALKKSECDFYEDEEIKELSTYKLVEKILRDAVENYKEKLNKDRKNSLVLSSLFRAEHDKMVTGKSSDLLKKATKEAMLNSVWNTKIVKMNEFALPGGHLSTFGNSFSLKKVREEILKQLSGLEKKCSDV